MKYVREESLSMIGSSVTMTAPEEIGLSSIRYFAMALGESNPLYYDADFAAKTRYGGIVAPPTFVCESIQYSTMLPDENGYIGHHWDLALPDSRNIRGGHEYEFFEPVRPYDRLTVTWILSDLYEQETQSRGLVIFVISHIEYRNQNGQLLARNKETLIYEPLDKGEL